MSAREGEAAAARGAFRIAILDDYHGVALSSADWSGIASQATIEVFRRPLGAEAARLLQPFHLLCTLRERMTIPRRLIEALPNLRHIVVTGKRYDAIDVSAAAEREISVSLCPPVSRENRGPGGVVELVWGLILSAVRRIPLEDRMLRQGQWQVGGPGVSLGGKTLGIVGLGQLGRRVAAIGSAFGMDVIAWSQNLTEDAARAAGAERVGRDALFSRADVITIHTVLSERTRGLVGQRELALMKPSAFLVNTARSAIVDEAALLETLRSRRIAGAALDVFAQEPLPADDPLLQLDNVVVTPHLGYYTEDALRGYYAGAVENIAAFLAGRPIRLVAPPTASEQPKVAS